MEILILMSNEQGSDLFTADDPVYDAHVAACGNDHVGSRVGRDAGSFDLGAHSAGAHDTSGALAHGEDLVVDLLNNIYKTRVFACSGVVGVEALDVRKEDQKIRPDKSRNDRGKRIVVTELDLVG